MKILRKISVFILIVFLSLTATSFCIEQNNRSNQVDTTEYDLPDDEFADVEPVIECDDVVVLIEEPEQTTEISDDEYEPEVVISPFYDIIASSITNEEKEILARLAFLEAGNQSFEGQKAVIEVVLNRVLSEEFPDTIYDVVYQTNQFSPAGYISSTAPTQDQYDAVESVLTETEPILNLGVVFFSTQQYNDYLFEKIGDHYFCYSKSYYEKMKGM
jgi:hypothetical protein